MSAGRSGDLRRATGACWSVVTEAVRYGRGGLERDAQRVALVVGGRAEIHKLAVEFKLRLMIVTGNHELDPKGLIPFVSLELAGGAEVDFTKPSIQRTFVSGVTASFGFEF